MEFKAVRSGRAPATLLALCSKKWRRCSFCPSRTVHWITRIMYIIINILDNFLSQTRWNVIPSSLLQVIPIKLMSNSLIWLSCIDVWWKLTHHLWWLPNRQNSSARGAECAAQIRRRVFNHNFVIISIMTTTNFIPYLLDFRGRDTVDFDSFLSSRWSFFRSCNSVTWTSLTRSMILLSNSHRSIPLRDTHLPWSTRPDALTNWTFLLGFFVSIFEIGFQQSPSPHSQLVDYPEIINNHMKE